MKTICLYFEIHQNIHLKRYRFFNIGTDHYYYDDYENQRSIEETAENSYIPALNTLIEMAHEHPGYFKCAVSLSGSAIELLERYSPKVIELLQELGKTGCVEFLAEPYSHGFSSLKNTECFKKEVRDLCTKVHQLFGQMPKIFRNSCLIYSNDIGETVAEMGFQGMLAEGAKHILGWKSPHYVYHCNRNPKLKLLLRDHTLSEDISYRFNDSSWSKYPLFADTYAQWIADLPEDHQVINLFMELCALGVFQPLSSNILPFFKALPEQFKQRGIMFSTPSEICSKIKSVGEIDAQDPTSWVDEERDLSPWLGNSMQQEACEKLYSVAERVRLSGNNRLKQDWIYLQASNNLRFMSTKPNSYGGYRGIYDSPYDAFINYMNILGDFISRVNSEHPNIDNEELGALRTTIVNQAEEITFKDKQIEKLQHMLAQMEDMEHNKVLSPEERIRKKEEAISKEEKVKKAKITVSATTAKSALTKRNSTSVKLPKTSKTSKA